MNLSVDAYLARIGLEQRPEGCTVENLRLLQKAHLTHIPYENLDLVRGIPVRLDTETVYQKVVVNGRGGYCFELNGLFAWLLRELGYPVTEYFARFIRDKEMGIPIRRHRVLRVTAADAGDFLCDVGVGGCCPLWPIPYGSKEPWTEPNGTWRFMKVPFFGWMIEELRHGCWQGYYAFTEEPQASGDYEATNYWCQTSPECVFRTTEIACLQTESGRRTLRGHQFAIFDGGRVEVIPWETQEERDALLDKWMNIRL